MRAAPSRRNGGPWPLSALRLNRPRRPRLSSWRRWLGAKACAPVAAAALRPPCALAAPPRASSGGGRGVRQALAVGVGLWWLAAPLAPLRRRAVPVGLAAGSQGRGGLLQAAKRPPASRPAAPAPPPVLSPGAGRRFVALRGFCRCGGNRCSGRDAARPLHYVGDRSPALEAYRDIERI